MSWPGWPAVPAAALAGVRHQVQSEPDPGWLRRPDVIRGLRAVAAAGLAYDLVILPHQLPAAAYAAAAVPELTLVLDHAGKPPVARGDLGSWAAAVRALAALPNTTCKLSGLVTEAPRGAPRQARAQALAEVASVVLGAFGADRVMFGFGLARLPARQRLRRAGDGAVADRRAVAERAAAFGATAARAYRLGAIARGLGRGCSADSRGRGYSAYSRARGYSAYSRGRGCSADESGRRVRGTDRRGNRTRSREHDHLR